MQYKTAGQILREKRQEEGWTLEEAERLTRIKRKYIKALEDDNYSAIPGDFYVRAYIKQYADRLGIDYSPLINFYETGQKVGSDSNHVGSLELPRKEKQYQEIEEEDDDEEEKSGFWKHLPIVLLSSAALLILGGVLAVVLLYKPDAPLSSSVPSTSTQEVSKESSSKSSESKKEKKTEESFKPKDDETKVEVSGEGAALQVNVNNAPKPLKLEISVDSGVKSWISVSNTDLAGGATLSDEQSKVSTELPVDVNQAVITLGVVPGVNITVDGKKVDMKNLTAQTAGTVSLQVSYKEESEETKASESTSDEEVSTEASTTEESE